MKREADLSLTLETAEQAVREWVTAPASPKKAMNRPAHDVMPPESGKVLTEEDDFDPEIAIERVLSILGFRHLHSGAASSPKRIEAAQRLTIRIEEFHHATSNQQPGMVPGRITAFVRAILTAWVELCRHQVPLIAARHLRSLITLPITGGHLA